MITIPKLAFTATLLGLTTAQINTPGPMLAHAYSDCEQFFQAVAGSNCVSVASVGGVTLTEFIVLNPSVAGKNGPDGCDDSKIIPGYFYCVKPLSQAGGRLPGHKPTPSHQGTLAKPKTTGKSDAEKKKEAEAKKKKEEAAKKKKKEEAAKKKKEEEAQKKKEKEKEKKKDDGKWHISGVNDPDPNYCKWGICWKSWVSLRTGGADTAYNTATDLCAGLRTMACVNLKDSFPTGIKNGCSGCQALSSGCSCEQKSRYHTATVNQYMRRDGLPQDYWATAGTEITPAPEVDYAAVG